ncbi:hypothetical protein KBZ10_01310 [Streptomyces sp. F63]|uniref:hypothetical protein n=1 Tax=Streptomyces sp. F63 TaxID=2824887 RepID=UPI001B364B03|nr:hypothetical protein [Streptomyces sp. F63]MBQ0983198.1 hypothetical protein [Streptomyces sp. F63]
MITARPPFAAQRFRSWTEPLRVLWLAVLVFGVVYVHAVSADGVTGHLPAPAPTFAATGLADPASPASGTGPGTGGVTEEASPERHGGGHGSDPSHPAPECLPGQPQQSPGPAAPCAPSPAGDRAVPAAAPGELSPGDPAAAGRLPADARRQAVLRI